MLYQTLKSSTLNRLASAATGPGAVKGGIAKAYANSATTAAKPATAGQRANAANGTVTKATAPAGNKSCASKSNDQWNGAAAVPATAPVATAKPASTAHRTPVCSSWTLESLLVTAVTRKL